MREWVVEALVKGDGAAAIWVRWKGEHINDLMTPETVEHCVERVTKMLHNVRGSIRAEIGVRIRNINTQEKIPAELFV